MARVLETGGYLLILVSLCLGKHRKQGKSIVLPPLPPPFHDPDELITSDGIAKVEVVMKSVFACGEQLSSSGTATRIVSKLLEDCGFDPVSSLRRKRDTDVMKEQACNMVCILKKTQMISKENKFITDELKLKKAFEMFMKSKPDDDKVEKLVAEIASCGKLTPGFNPDNCYTAIPYGVCMYFAARKTCMT